MGFGLSGVVIVKSDVKSWIASQEHSWIIRQALRMVNEEREQKDECSIVVHENNIELAGKSMSNN